MIWFCNFLFKHTCTDSWLFKMQYKYTKKAYADVTGGYSRNIPQWYVFRLLSWMLFSLWGVESRLRAQ